MPGNTPHWGAAYVVAISPADIGQRVSIRRELTDGRDGLGDVIGEIVSWSDGVIVLRRRDGELVEVAENTVVAGKRVPPQPERAR